MKPLGKYCELNMSKSELSVKHTAAQSRKSLIYFHVKYVGEFFIYFFSTKGYLIETAPKFILQNSAATCKLAPGSCSV